MGDSVVVPQISHLRGIYMHCPYNGRTPNNKHAFGIMAGEGLSRSVLLSIYAHLTLPMSHTQLL